MSYSRTYGGSIWTDHALSRLKERRIPQEVAWRAFKYPESTIKGRKQGSFECVKTQHGRAISVVAKQNDRREWLILSAWAEPPYPGSVDLKPTSKTQSLFRWITNKIVAMFSRSRNS